MEEIISASFANLELFEQMYVQYQMRPNNVSADWKKIFSDLQNQEGQNLRKKISTEERSLLIDNLIHAYRCYGYLLANVNPIALSPPREPEQLELTTLGFTDSDLNEDFPTQGFLEKNFAPLLEIIEALRKVYCGVIGFEYIGLQGASFERWLQSNIESTHFCELSIQKKEMIIQQLNRSELLESFLHTKYVGQKRFSIEGSETLIPMLAETIEAGAVLGAEEFILGMSHRGRLNVLSNIMNKSYAEIFSEFEEGYLPDRFEGSGDVKYHKGYSSELITSKGYHVKIDLTPNPSHLESVDPVVEGQVRAKLIQKDDMTNKELVIPILIHGDAALAGQGVVYETMQFCKLAGYSTGGTIHFVVNNQIGFTTLPIDSRSTYECTDIAKTFLAPVFHVNAEQPEACICVTSLAMEIRKKFHCDVFINLNCYRKYGHNEGDEPFFTQPLEYKKIRQKKAIRELYRDQLIAEGVFEKKLAEDFENQFKKDLQKALEQAKTPLVNIEKTHEPIMTPPEEDFFTTKDTGVPLKMLQELALRFCSIPKGFEIHPKVKNLIQERLAMVKGDKLVDWGMAETLAIASLLWEGVHVRLTGQDSCRGTFSHRHGVWTDQLTGKKIVPLSLLQENQEIFEIYNSPLSEYAALGFEYGYSMAYPQALVIWEAQFGDFCNGAQVIIDQYISSAEQKWGRKVPLVLLLPHGYEGQGPEHSSARIERFLSLTGKKNMIVANPTTPLQFFHLLRRQVLSSVKKPLIIFTPKGLLRHAKSTNSILDFTRGYFQPVMDDPNPPEKPTRLVFCSGRIFYDLDQERSKITNSDLLIVRIEQLYPLDKQKILEVINKYHFQEFLWVQEEPSNKGAWHSLYFEIQPLLPQRAELKYIGRERSASPAVGSYELHKKEYLEIIKNIFKT